MRRVFQEVYPTCFDAADVVYIRRPSMIDKVPVDERLSSRRLVDDLLRRGLRARLFADTEGILDALAAEARPGDVVLVMSNGGFDNIHEKLLKLLEKRANTAI
jgi:UDP-N-acetylmuramate: L-alanyl-gamma-D-glutamyl-meso-diaminopimelate ligase